MGNTNIGSNSTLKVSEIFYSLQGEGFRKGEASLFVRLQGCTAKHACFKSGVICDTEFESGKSMELVDIAVMASKSDTNWITWTGGEPTDQVTDYVVNYFKEREYKQSIECSGIKQPPFDIEWIVLSPKIAEHVILKKWKTQDTGYHCDELRWVRQVGQSIPKTKIQAGHYYISPHYDGINVNQDNVRHCIDLCLKNPKWKLSTQEHKTWNVR